MGIFQSKEESDRIARTAIDAMQDKKGNRIIKIDLGEVPNTVTNYFVICHGTSKVQVDTIAKAVEDKVRIEASNKPWHVEGRENGEWVLIDYVDVVIHIFQEEIRDFYQLEQLWADAPQEQIN